MTLRIVLVDDNPADAYLAQRAFQATGTDTEVVWLKDGVEALEHLLSDPWCCDLVLLDLSMPRLNGFEVLERLRARDEFNTLPIVVLSGSCDPADIKRSYGSGANTYVCKPVHADDIFAMANTMIQYWSRCAVTIRQRTPETKVVTK